MSSVDRYVEQVMERVYAPRDQRERLEADLRARFEQGLAERETEADVRQRLGSPQEIAEAFMAEVELQYAGFVERVIAFLADMAAFFILIMPPVALAVLLLARAEGAAQLPAVLMFGMAVSVGIVVSGVIIFYFPVLESLFGCTLGKRLMGLRVRREDGSRVGLGPAFVRRLSFYFEILVLDALFVPFTEKKQRAFDIVAKTVVLRDPDRSARGTGVALCVLLMAVAVAFGLAFGAVIPMVQ